MDLSGMNGVLADTLQLCRRRRHTCDRPTRLPAVEASPQPFPGFVCSLVHVRVHGASSTAVTFPQTSHGLIHGGCHAQPRLLQLPPFSVPIPTCLHAGLSRGVRWPVVLFQYQRTPLKPHVTSSPSSSTSPRTLSRSPFLRGGNGVGIESCPMRLVTLWRKELEESPDQSILIGRWSLPWLVICSQKAS